MKRKYTVIVMAVLIMALIVTFSMIGCKKVTVVTPAITVETTAAPTETTAAPTETTAPETTS